MTELTNKPWDYLTQKQKEDWEKACDKNNVQDPKAFHKTVTSQWNREQSKSIKY